MNVWKLTAANNLVKFDENLSPQEGKIRVRITKLFVNKEDALIYSGQRKVRYPVIPGRFAVGLVADENGGAQFPKNARVLLHHFLPAEDTGTAERTFTEDDYRICGQTADGFLRDFVYVTPDEITLLPDAVNDEKALLLPLIALAKATVETLHIQRGEHVAVIGANNLGVFVSRLLIYQQASPILIDSHREKLEFARGRGIYYTSLNDEHLMNVVGTITGGRLADAVVFTPAGADFYELSLKVCATGKHIAYVGHTAVSIPLDIADVMKKRLTIHGLCDGTDYLETAINLIANKAIDLSAFRFVTTPANGVPALFASLAENSDRAIDEINIVSLI